MPSSRILIFFVAVWNVIIVPKQVAGRPRYHLPCGQHSSAWQNEAGRDISSTRQCRCHFRTATAHWQCIFLRREWTVTKWRSIECFSLVSKFPMIFKKKRSYHLSNYWEFLEKYMVPERNREFCSGLISHRIRYFCRFFTSILWGFFHRCYQSCSSIVWKWKTTWTQDRYASKPIFWRTTPNWSWVNYFKPLNVS